MWSSSQSDWISLQKVASFLIYELVHYEVFGTFLKPVFNHTGYPETTNATENNKRYEINKQS